MTARHNLTVAFLRNYAKTLDRTGSPASARSIRRLALDHELAIPAFPDMTNVVRFPVQLRVAS